MDFGWGAAAGECGSGSWGHFGWRSPRSPLPQDAHLQSFRRIGFQTLFPFFGWHRARHRLTHLTPHFTSSSRQKAAKPTTSLREAFACHYSVPVSEIQWKFNVKQVLVTVHSKSESVRVSEIQWKFTESVNIAPAQKISGTILPEIRWIFDECHSLSLIQINSTASKLTQQTILNIRSINPIAPKFHEVLTNNFEQLVNTNCLQIRKLDKSRTRKSSKWKTACGEQKITQFSQEIS